MPPTEGAPDRGRGPDLSPADGAPRKRILLVDDEARILSALRRSLRREGYQFVCVESAQDALAILSQERFDAVVSDHKMPRMSGLQLLAEAERRQPAAARMLITGWTEELPRDELARRGICALITKPWDDAALKATLRRALHADGRGAGVFPPPARHTRLSSD